MIRNIIVAAIIALVTYSVVSIASDGTKAVKATQSKVSARMATIDAAAQ